MVRAALALAGLATLSCGGTRGTSTQAAAPTKPSVSWKIDVHADLRIDERICWSGFAPGHLRPEMIAALPFAEATTDDGQPLAFDDVGVPMSASTGCVRLRIPLEPMGRALADEAALTVVGDVVYGSFDPWLWRPGVWPPGLRGKLVVETAPGISVSFPHRREADGSWEVPFATWSFMARAAIGRLTTSRVTVGDCTLRVVRLPGAAPAATSDGIDRVVEAAARAAASLDSTTPKMPVNDVLVFLLPGRARSADAVQFGLAMRGGGASVALRIAPTATDDELLGEWVMPHELSHLWLPPVSRDGMWLSEGLASYYQNILRSRVGLLSEERAWDELVRGFARGKSQAGDVPLRAAQRPRFQQIYWGGAAIALKLDVLLRKRGTSLDAVIAEIRRSTPTDEDESSIEEMLARFERTSGMPGLRARIEAWLDLPFVDVSAELAELGVLPRAAAAPGRALREAIAGAR
jgi:hypothetical protein